MKTIANSDMKRIWKNADEIPVGRSEIRVRKRDCNFEILNCDVKSGSVILEFRIVEGRFDSQFQNFKF